MKQLIKGATSLRATILTIVAVLALAASAQAQSLTLTDASDTMLRGGSYANTNFGTSAMLATRASSTDEYARRVLLKFDTHSTIAAGSSISAAKLTLTVRGGNGETRTLSAYRVPEPYTDTQATWKQRRTSLYWAVPGGDMAERIGQATVTSVVGSKVTYDVTAVVQKIVSGVYGSSRYLRVLLVDEGASSRDSYKEFHSMEAGGGIGPTLGVTLGTSIPPPSEPAPSGTRLKVFEWNTHHGIGTDGRYDIDRIASFIAKHNPDVVAINEGEMYTGFGNEDQPRRYRDLLQQKTGVTWYYHHAQEYGDWDSPGKTNLLLSKYPFASQDRHVLSWDRSVATGTIVVNGRNISILVTHLDHEYQSRRYTQANEVKSYASGIAENRILTGDWNAWPDQTSVTTMYGTYYDAWVEAKKLGTATYYASYTEGQTKNGRIDYIYYSKGASNLKLVKMQLLDSRFDSSGNMPSDHRPIMATFEVR